MPVTAADDKDPRLKGFGRGAPEFTAYRSVRDSDQVAILCGPCPALGATPDDPLAGDWLLCVDLDGDLTPEGLSQALQTDVPETLATHAGKHLWYRVEPGAHRDRLRQWNSVLGLRKGWAGDGKAPDADLKWCGGYARERKEPAEVFDVAAIEVLPVALAEAIIARKAPLDARDSEPLAPVRMALDPDAVERMVAALVEAWPAEGEGRHDAFLALGGMLRRGGARLADTEAIAQAIVDGTGSDRARVKDAADAWRRADRGEAAYGWSTLAGLLHGDAETLLQAIDEATGDPWIAMMTERWPTLRRKPAKAAAATALDAVDALQEWVSDHVRACREELRTPLDLNLACALGVGSAAIAGKIKVRVHSNYVSHTAMWWCAVATPGELKSPAYKLAAAPIKAWVAERQDAERDALEQRRMKRDKLAKDVERLNKTWADGYDNDPLAPEAAELREKRLLLEATQPPVPFELLIEDITPEAVVDLLATHGRIACMSDEGSKVFGVLAGQYSKGQADLSAWLQAIDGTLPKVHRIGRKAVKSQHVEATLSVVLTTQPEVMNRVTGNAAMAGEGFVQRLCWVIAPKVTEDRWAPGEIPTPVPAPVAETWDAGVRFLLDLPATEVRLSGEAFRVYIAWRDELEPRIRRGDLSGDMGGWASKHLDRTVRIAALLWAFDGAEGREITAEQMARAVTIGRWLVPHAVAAIVGGREATRRAALERRVAELLSEQPRTAAALSKCLGKAQQTELPDALARMSEQGRIVFDGSRYSLCV